MAENNKPKRTIVTDAEILHKISEPVDVGSTEFVNNLAQDLLSSYFERPALGLAAPQIGIHSRAFVAQLFSGVFVFVNPRLELSGHKCPSTEGCLSIPNTTRIVERDFQTTIDADIIIKLAHRRINRVEGPIVVTGQESFILQHENDHLDGILMTDRPHVTPTIDPKLALKQAKKLQKYAIRRDERKIKSNKAPQRMSEKNRLAYEQDKKRLAKREKTSVVIKERYNASLERSED